MLATVDVERQARAAGIDARRGVSLEAVEQRRQQLWVVMSIVLALVSAGAGAATLFPALSKDMPVSPRILHLALPVVSLGFAVYALEKQRMLQRLSSALVEDRMRREQLSVQARQLRAALDAGKDLSACQDVDAVAVALLAGAVEVFGASDGSFLVLRDGRLELAARQGHDRGAHLDHDAVELVAETGIPVLLKANETDGAHGMCVPVFTSHVHHGVLVVSAGHSPGFTDHDLSVLAAFAEHGAQAIETAHRLEAARAGTDRLRALEDARSEFSWLRHDAATA